MASSAGVYKRILLLLEKWPVDKNKAGGRDIKEHLSNFVNTAYKENKFETNHKYWDKQYIAIQKLVSNSYKNKYKRCLATSATGLSAEDCNIALSNECLDELNQKNQSFFKKLISLKPDQDKISRQYCTVVKQSVELNVPHKPVMLDEVLKYLNLQKQDTTVMDMTFGAGGHSKKILENAPGAKLIALDRDPVAYQYAEKLANDYPSQVIPLLGRFSNLPELLKAKGIGPNSIDCILLDCGCSSMQFDNGSRGFSISHNGPLDMRMDGNRLPDAPTAADVLAKATEEDLYKIIKIYGEEKQARKIARAIIEARYMFKPLKTTVDLADLVKSVCTEDFRLDKLQRRSHVATKTFQALRIFINNELNEINYAFILAHYYLKLGGRVVALSFHSLEDTIAKRHLTGNLLGNVANPLPLKYNNYSTTVDQSLVEQIMKPKWKMLHQHVLLPKYEEVEYNPRSRSAKLRAAVKVM